MSKERELLRRISSHSGSVIPSHFIYEIRELLQPEQSNEPVAWRGVNFTEAEGIWLYRDFDEPFTDSNFKNVGEALYLAPQKQKPLSLSEIVEGSGFGEKTFGYTGGFYDGVRWAEQQHGIGL